MYQIQILPIHLRPSPDMSSPLPPYKQIYFTLKHNPIKTTEVSTFNNYHSVLSLTFRKLTITNNVNDGILSSLDGDCGTTEVDIDQDKE